MPFAVHFQTRAPTTFFNIGGGATLVFAVGFQSPAHTLCVHRFSEALVMCSRCCNAYGIDGEKRTVKN